MNKALLFSIIAAMIAIPVIASRDPRPARALKKTLLYGLCYLVFYGLALRYLLPRL